jgi:phosphorylase kinase alpha/beta subunit
MTQSIDDVREGPVVQEIISYLGNLMRAQPSMFDGILRLRTHYIIIALREEISRVNHFDEEEAVEHLMQLSPFELKSLLFTILSGPNLCTSTNNIVVRDQPGGILMLPTDVQKEDQQSYIPIHTESKSITIRAQSGGYFAGNFARVEINNTVMEAGSRGIHIWAIDRKESIILERASFDTHISKEESSDFARFVDWIQPGMMVVIASKDDFIEHLTENAIEALERLGSKKIRDVQYRDSYVFIGEKGNVYIMTLDLE